MLSKDLDLTSLPNTVMITHKSSKIIISMTQGYDIATNACKSDAIITLFPLSATLIGNGVSSCGYVIVANVYE
jgi:hypothetical protein